MCTRGMKLLSQAHGIGAAVAAVVVALAVGFSGRSKPAQLGDPATPGVPFISQPFEAVLHDLDDLLDLGDLRGLVDHL